MTKQCSWCQEFDGQTYWKVSEGNFGEKGVIRLKPRQALISVDSHWTGEQRVVVDVQFCSDAHAEEWKKNIGGKFFEWVKPKKKRAKDR